MSGHDEEWRVVNQLKQDQRVELRADRTPQVAPPPERRVRIGTPACEGLHCHLFTFEGGMAGNRWEEHHRETCPHDQPTGIYCYREPERDPWPWLMVGLAVVAVLLWLVFVQPQLP